MRVRVIRMRHLGQPVERGLLQRQPAVVGDLSVDEARDEILQRTIRRARLAACVPTDGEPAPPLYDVQLLWMGPRGFVVAGMERIAGADYAQGWWCCPTLSP